MEKDKNITEENLEETKVSQEEETPEVEESQEKGDSETLEEEESSKDEKEDAEKYLRLMADFQNYKRRTEKERADIYAFANEKIVAQVLDVLDNFERALGTETEDKKYAEGMALIFKQLKDVMEKSGVEEIKAEGETFDPNFHNAVMTEDNPDVESGKITAVLQKGYTLNKKVVRHSMVKVNN